MNNKLDIWAWVRISIAVLLIIGAYIAGVIAGFDKNPYERGSREKYGSHSMNKAHESMDMSQSHNPMDMSMADMGKMLEGKTGAELNKAFLEGMIPHHEGAIEMAKYLANSDKPELVKLGGEIITAQSKEIDQMKAWLIEWGYTSSGSTSNTDMMKSHCAEMPEMSGCEQYR